MYAVHRPSKFLTSTRRGGTKKIDSFEGRDRGGQGTALSSMSSPVPVFNGKRSNGRGSSINSSPSDEPVSPQHKDCVHFLSHVWSNIQHDMEHPNWSRKPKIYREKTPNPQLESFKAFDLEEWWGARTLQKIKESS